MANNAVVGILRALLTLDTAQFESGMRKAQDGAKAFSRSTKQIGTQATQIGSALTRTLTLPILGFGAAVAKAAIDFESSFAGVRKTVTATEAEFAQMSNSLRALSREIPVDVNELNRLAEAAGALGIPKAEIVDFAKVMAQLGVTTNVTSDQAAESIAQIQTIFQAAGKETDRFASTLVDLGNKGASTEKQILELANRIASAGRAVGMSQADVLGFSSAIANVGIEAEAGGTAISKVFSDLSMAASRGGEDIAAFAKVAGQSTEQFAKLFKEDASAAVVAFVEGLGKAQKAGGDLNLILEDLGFKEVRQARALRDLALSGDNLAKALRIANTAWRENTALSEEARKRFETTHSQLTLLWNRIKDVGITLGNSLLPLIKATVSAMNTLVPLFERAANVFGKMPVPVQALAVAFGLTLAAVGPLLFIFGQLVLAASAVTGAFTKTGIATRALSALMTGAGGIATSVRAAGVAFTSSAVAVGVFTAALAGIVVPLALMKVAELIEQIKGLLKDSEQWRVNALAENAVHLNMMAEASRVAGREITNYNEALSILRTRITLLQLGNFRDQQNGAAAATATLGNATQSMTAKLAEANRILNGLTAAMRAELQAGLTLGQSNKELAESFNKLFPAVKLSEEAVGLFRDRIAEAGKKAKDATKDLTEAQQAAQRWLDILGEIESAEINKKVSPMRIIGDLGEPNPFGIPTLDDMVRQLEELENPETEWRAFQNEMGIRAMEDEAARMELRTRRWREFRDGLKQLFSNVVGSLGEGLGSLLFGGGNGNDDAKRAKAYYEELKKSGTASAEAITRAYLDMRSAQAESESRWQRYWSNVKRTAIQALDQLFSYIVNQFLGGVIKALATAALGQRIGNFVSTALGIGSTAASVGTTAATTGTTAAVAAGTGTSVMAGASVLETSAATGAAAGTGGGLASFLTAAGPWAAFAAPFIIAYWDWNRGQPLSPERIEQLKRYRAGTGRPALAGLFDRERLRSFSHGGFVPPNAVVPAVLHGGSMGEIVTPVSKLMQSKGNDRPTLVQNITINGSVADKRVWREAWQTHILPMQKEALMLNTDGLATTTGKSVLG